MISLRTPPVLPRCAKRNAFASGTAPGWPREAALFMAGQSHTDLENAGKDELARGTTPFDERVAFSPMTIAPLSVAVSRRPLT